MDAAQYDAWYATPRGSWIGETEYRLLCQLLTPKPGDTLLDIGCGTGYFTRRFASEGFDVTGVDPDPRMLEFASAHRTAAESYVLADARSLPFPDGAFDLCVSVTALCFIREESRALAEMQRVARRRFCCRPAESTQPAPPQQGSSRRPRRLPGCPLAYGARGEGAPPRRRRCRYRVGDGGFRSDGPEMCAPG
jgi:SAM-dependent methyltransferase